MVIKYINYEINNGKIENKDFSEKFEFQKPDEYNVIKDDWYNLGVFIYEMLMNIPPFYNKDGKLKFSKLISISDNAKNLLLKLLDKNNNNRINDISDLENDNFYKNINFKDVLENKIEPKIKPFEQISEEELNKEQYNISNFDMPDEDINDNEDIEH